jgi:ATP-dependent Clp protease ATP-binding subunit ClpB
MDFSKFTLKAQEVIQRAQQIVLQNGQQVIENAHLLKGILEVDENVTPFLLKKLNVNLPVFEQALDRIVQGYTKVTGGQLTLSMEANTTLNKAQNFMREFNDEFVSIEHLLLALTEGKDNASQLLRDNGVSSKELKKAVEQLR